MYSRIVVPLDGSHTSESALPAASGLAEAFGAPLHLVRVVESSVFTHESADAMTYAYVTMGDILEDGATEASQYLADHASSLREHGHDVASETLVGPVSESILAVVEPGDLIVMCSQGRSGLRRFLLGSVAESVVRQCEVPVHLVKPAEE